MGKFLRVLTVFIFLLSIAALTLGIMLFNKREMLKGRAQTLERSVSRLVKTLEFEDPAPPDPLPEYPARDISECTEVPLADPTRSDFWNSYKPELELNAEEFVNLDSQAKQRELMSYYKWDLINDRPERDPLTGEKMTKGEGTMLNLLEDVIKRAQSQLDRLMSVRAQLIATRQELESTITELNQRKMTLREKLAEIVRLNAEIARLNGIIEQKNMEIAELKETIKALELRIQDLEQDKRKLQEDLDDQRIKNEKLTATVAELRGIIKRLEGTPTDTRSTTENTIESMDVLKLTIKPGAKGAVGAVNAQHGFVVMKLNEEFLKELHEQLQTPNHVPAVTLIVKRGDVDPKFIAKVKLIQLKEAQQLGIGDILDEWQQEPIQVGDTIIYQ
jgi:predicted  nucleic acid-binding Zn-ribbon protein